MSVRSKRPRSVAVWSWLVLAVAGCAADGAECTIDPDCGDEVCTRAGECAPASEVRPVRVTWTVRGAPASRTSCGTSPELYVDFIGANLDDLASFDPVPCANGSFFVDKLPRRFGRVEIGVEGLWYDITNIATDGTATLDLSPATRFWRAQPRHAHPHVGVVTREP